MTSGLKAVFLEGEKEAKGFPVDGPFQLQNAQTLGINVEDTTETVGRRYLAAGVVTVVDADIVAVTDGITVSIDVAVTVDVTVNLAIWDTVTNITDNPVVLTVCLCIESFIPSSPQLSLWPDTH